MTTEDPNPSSSSQSSHPLDEFLLPLTLLFASVPSAAEAVPESLVNTFKSIPASLAHPGMMWLLFFTSVYTGYLGFQSRQLRSLPPAEKKEIAKKKPGETHYKISAALFATMTIFTFGGMANTYTRTGKLFPGPHLYAGLGLVALMAVMVSVTPYMQRGKDWARNAHFAMGIGAVSMFAWQAKTGMDIVAKLLKW